MPSKSLTPSLYIMLHHQRYVRIVVNATQRWRTGAGMYEAVPSPSGDPRSHRSHRTSQANRIWRVDGLLWIASWSEHDLDVESLCFPKSWGFDSINTLMFALRPYPNRALFIHRAPYFITPDLKHHHEARSCCCVLFWALLDPR